MFGVQVAADDCCAYDSIAHIGAGSLGQRRGGTGCSRANLQLAIVLYMNGQLNELQLPWHR